MEKLLNYKDAKIYVRKIQSKMDDQQDNSPEGEDDSFDSSFLGVSFPFSINRFLSARTKARLRISRVVSTVTVSRFRLFQGFSYNDVMIYRSNRF